MTQAYNLSQLANNLNTAGQLDATDGLVNAVPAANGGTGQSTYAVGDLLYASGATAIAKLPDIATGNVLISGGVAAAPSYGKVGLTTHVNGTLGLANGGTNSTATPVAGSVIVGTGSAMAATAAGTAGQVLTSAGAGTPTWATVAAAQNNAQVFSTVGTGQTFTIPSGVTRIKVTLIGGGGTGGAGGATGGGGSIDYYGPGGGGGGTAIKWLAVSGGGSGGTLTISVGGAGGSSSIASGTSNTITTVTASGGSGLIPGAGTNGDLNIPGGNGTSGNSSAATLQTLGGGTFMANMSNGTGKLYGGGGAGGYGSGGSGLTGAQGVVIIEY